MWCHAGWIKGKQPLNFNAPDWSSEERRTTPPLAAGVDVVEGIAIKKCTIISLFSRTAGGRTWSQKAMKNNGCQSHCPVTKLFHKHIPQTHSTHTFHKYISHIPHIPQTHSPKQPQKQPRSARARVALTFVFVFCIVVHGIVQNQTPCRRTVDRGRRLPRGLPLSLSFPHKTFVQFGPAARTFR